MQPVLLRLKDNVQRIRARITAAAERADRAPERVRMVAVTKTVDVDVMRGLIDLGVTDLGENRVEMARPKMEALGGGVCWHMIGTVQRRKARDVATLFDCVHSIDRVEVGEALARQAAMLGRGLKAFVEVNVSGEASKHGFAPDTVEEALTKMNRFDGLTVVGLMTMAPFEAEPEDTRPVFRRLKSLADGLGLPELSMGMSNDFEVAVEEGATIVRIGTALFQ